MEFLGTFHNSRKLAALLPLSLIALMGLMFAVPPVHAQPECSPAGTTGLTTLITATSGQTIMKQTIDATGCDIGIFVPPGSSNVVIMMNTITGAGIHGIFVQDSSDVQISMNTVTGNSGGVHAVSCDVLHAPPDHWDFLQPHTRQGQHCGQCGSYLRLRGQLAIWSTVLISESIFF